MKRRRLGRSITLLLGLATVGALLVRVAWRVDAARYEAFPETDGLKINAGCLMRASGRLYAGTDGMGLWRSSADGARFERLALALPSPRVTALVAAKETLFIGTDEGLARLALAHGP